MTGDDDQHPSPRFQLLDPAPAADRWLEETDETFGNVARMPVPDVDRGQESDETFDHVAAHPAPYDERSGESDETFHEIIATTGGAPDLAPPPSVPLSDRVPDPEIARLREDAAARIAAAERLELQAFARRREAEDRQSETWAADQQRRFAERLDAMLDAEAAAVAERRLTEGDRLSAWGQAERERIKGELAGELAAEEQHFHDRLLRQLEAFEFQLGERLREQEERMGRWIAEAERIVETRTGSRRS